MNNRQRVLVLGGGGFGASSWRLIREALRHPSACEIYMRRFLARLRARRRVAITPPSLPLLEYVPQPREADWMPTSVSTFGEGLVSFVPGHFEAYARVYHPFEYGNGTAAPARSWRELAAAAGLDLSDPAAAAEFASFGSGAGQAQIGRLPPLLLAPLVEHLRRGTSTADRCYFAVWEGHGDLVVPAALEPTLELPYRRYHVFSGPIEAAHTSFSVADFVHLSANLWWPADRAWCVATEIDFAWTYVGGARPIIEALLDDARLDAVETTAVAPW
jgi:hypothetical protein